MRHFKCEKRHSVPWSYGSFVPRTEWIMKFIVLRVDNEIIFWNLSESFAIFWNLLQYFRIFQNLSESFRIFQNLSDFFYSFIFGGNLLESYSPLKSLQTVSASCLGKLLNLIVYVVCHYRSFQMFFLKNHIGIVWKNIQSYKPLK